MDLDLNTLFQVTMHVELLLGLLLLFAWSQSFGKRALAWWATAHLFRAVSVMLLGQHGAIPNWLSIDVGNVLLFGSFALTWSGARVFGRRNPEPVWGFLGIIIWLVAAHMPQVRESPDLQMLLACSIISIYVWLTAFELWRGRDEDLISRWPLIFMLFAHGALFLLRTPLGAVLHLAPSHELAPSAWFDVLSLEALLFTISIAFLMLAIAKERTESHHRAAAQTDALTGISNRRGFLEQTAALKRGTSEVQTIGVLMFDIDNFKAINDQFGHAVGDRALQIFADIMRCAIGPTGVVGRWGGDEFAAVVYDATWERTAALAEHIRISFEQVGSDIDGRPAHATVSAGAVVGIARPFDLPALLLHADETLYRAKERGRNCVEMAPPVPGWETSPQDTVIPSLKTRPRKASAA
jgi:diguanylate cyclase (GGDEF)-like protein